MQQLKQKSYDLSKVIIAFLGHNNNYLHITAFKEIRLEALSNEIMFIFLNNCLECFSALGII